MDLSDPTDPRDPVHPGAPTVRPGLVLFTVCLAQFVVMVSVMNLFVALPAIQQDLGFDATGLSWVVNAYTLTFGGFLLLGGRGADLFGRRRVFRIGLTLFAVASFLCGLATAQLLLLVFRAMQGLGAALLASAALSILTTTFPEGPRRRRALALWSAINAGSAAFGLLLGGVLTALLSWPVLFFVNGTIAVAIVLLAVRAIPESRVAATEGFDLPGAFTVTTGVVTLVYTVLHGSQRGWLDPLTVTAGLAAVALLGAFVAIQHHRHAPLVRLSVFRLRTLTAANATMFLLAGAPGTVFYLMTLYFQRTLQYSALQTALALLPASLTVAMGSLIANRLLLWLSPRTVLMGAIMLVVVGPVLLTSAGPTSGYVTGVLPATATIFLGCSCAMVTLIMLATSRLPDTDAGLASGLIGTTSQLGSGLWLAVFSSLAAVQLGFGLPGYTAALRGVALLALAAGALVAALLRGQHATGEDQVAS